LRDHPDTLRVFLYAPRESKVRRLIAEGMDARKAEELVDTVDNERAAFVDKYFHMEWPHRAVYHAMLNTDAGEEAVTQTILGLRSTLEQPAQ
jgi:cytidylate kinase